MIGSSPHRYLGRPQEPICRPIITPAVTGRVVSRRSEAPAPSPPAPLLGLFFGHLNWQSFRHFEPQTGCLFLVLSGPASVFWSKADIGKQRLYRRGDQQRGRFRLRSKCDLPRQTVEEGSSEIAHFNLQNLAKCGQLLDGKGHYLWNSSPANRLVTRGNDLP